MPDRPPLLSLVLGYGPALVLLALGVGAWLVGDDHAPLVIEAGRLWAAAILLFLSGVRRGLSFFTPGGPRAAQVVTALALFTLGLAALALPMGLAPVLLFRLSLGVLILGYGAVGVLDARAALTGDVPRHFRALRPPQMAIAITGLALLLVRTFA